jgi:tRNA(fMet)-specific endonuclease VapC
MKYLLDANIVVALLRGRNATLDRRVQRHRPADLAISSIIIHGLYYGAFKSARPSHNVALVDALQFQVVDFDREDARHAGEIRAILGLRGTPVGPFDVLIAGQARARNLVLVTHNSREFSRVPGLRIDDWLS